jgi:hypothetical protein
VAVALFTPVCSITTTKRRRFFWAAWLHSPPTRIPFKKPDASDGGASTREEALAAAEKRAGVTLAMIDPLWARAWIRILRGEAAWPTKASREPSRGRPRPEERKEEDVAQNKESIWILLGIGRDATPTELKAAYRKRALETHPDHGGNDESFRRIVAAYEEALRRINKPKPKPKPKKRTTTTTTKTKRKTKRTRAAKENR